MSSEEEKQSKENSDGENGNNKRREEYAKLAFEYSKHLTSLSVAASVALVALYRDVIEVQFSALFIALITFALCTIVSLFSMGFILNELKNEGPIRYVPIDRFTSIAAALLIAGVVSFVDEAVRQEYFFISSSSIFVVLALIFVLHLRKST